MPSRVLDLLSDDRYPPDALLSSLESLSREGVPAYSGALAVLAPLALGEEPARAVLERILAHRAVLAAALGRDPGLRVAAADLLLNVDRAAEGCVPAPLFDEILEREVRRGRRFRHPVGLLHLELEAADGEEGAAAEGLRAARRALRASDTACRAGATGMRILLAETPGEGARAAARRIAGAVDRATAGRCTVRGSAVAYPEDAGDAGALRARADEARRGAAVVRFPGSPA